MDRNGQLSVEILIIGFWKGPPDASPPHGIGPVQNIKRNRSRSSRPHCRGQKGQAGISPNAQILNVMDQCIQALQAFRGNEIVGKVQANQGIGKLRIGLRGGGRPSFIRGTEHRGEIDLGVLEEQGADSPAIFRNRGSVRDHCHLFTPKSPKILGFQNVQTRQDRVPGGFLGRGLLSPARGGEQTYPYPGRQANESSQRKILRNPGGLPCAVFRKHT